MKKIISLLMSMLLIFGCSVTVISCRKNKGENKEEKTVMNMKLNPEVEFILDHDGKVISVNALNEEGNLIITAASFDGKTAEEAAKLFVSISHDLGFVISGSHGQEEIEISFSGSAEEAEQLFNSVKTKVEEYFSAENINAKLEQAEAITREELEELVTECEGHISRAEAHALSQMELIEIIYESRKETVNMHSEELKKAYYEAKAHALEQAEFEILKSKLDIISQTAVDFTLTAYDLAVKTLEDIRMSQLVSENSLYQLALADLRQVKIDYLTYREEVMSMEESARTQEMLDRLDTYGELLEAAEAKLESAGDSAEAMLNNAKLEVEKLRDQILSAIANASVKANDHLDEISAKQLQAEAAFFTSFETEYAGAIAAANTNWQNMKAELEARTSTQE